MGTGMAPSIPERIRVLTIPHHRPAAGAQDRRALLEPEHRLSRRESYVPQGRYPLGQQQVQQGDQALAVGMQEAEVARTPETFGQHMLQNQPQEVRAGIRTYCVFR